MGSPIDLCELMDIRQQLDEFLTAFDDVCHDHRSRDHMRTYCGGQLGTLERKCVAPIALEAGVPPRSLQEFLEIHRWDHEKTRRRVTELVMQRHADENAIALIDETTFAKKGDKTAGVQRQHCGSTGKTDNCVTTVHLGYATDDFQTLIDADIFLPASWVADPRRCREAGIPGPPTHRPQWQIAVDLLVRAIEAGARFRFLTADEAYGRCEAFRRAAAAMDLMYVVEVPCSLTAWRHCPPLIRPEDDTPRRGPKRLYPGLAPAAPSPHRVDHLVRRSRQDWTTFHVKDTQKGPVVWQVKAMRVYPWSQQHLGEDAWLIAARNVLNDERKYFLSNAPRDASLAVLVHVAFSRSRIEALFEASKGQVGFDHFEVRQYRPLMRHLILSMVSLLFLEEQTQRLREKKRGVDRAPSPRSARGPTGPDLAPRRAPTSCGAGGPQDRVLARAQRPSDPLTPQTAVPGTETATHTHINASSVFQSVLAL